MDRHKPPGGPFDIKLGPGGLVDLEFAVHMLQLGTGSGSTRTSRSRSPRSARPGWSAPEIDPALRLLTRILVILRLVSPELGEPPEPSRALVARACGLPDWDGPARRARRRPRAVRALWLEVSGQPSVNGLAARPFRWQTGSRLWRLGC